MALMMGVLLAISVGLFATFVGLDRDRAFYPVVTIVIASYFVLFAVIGNSSQALLLELIVCAAFVLAAVAGFRKSLWIVVCALAVHGIQDFFHASVIQNPGVPPWWPGFCATFDVTAAAYLAWLIKRGRTRAAG